MRYPLISGLALSAILAACTETEEDPLLGPPEAVMQSQSAVWRANEKRPFVFDAQEWNLDDTTTYSCESRNGVVGTCVRVRRCCGEPPVRDTVSGCASPSELFARLRKDVGMLKYDYAESGDHGFTAKRHGANGIEVVAGIDAAFHRDLGYPRSVVWFGASPDSGVNITRLEFK